MGYPPFVSGRMARGGALAAATGGGGGGGAFSTKSVASDGANDYIAVGDVTEINSATNLSTSCWFKINSGASWGGDGQPLLISGGSSSWSSGSDAFYVQVLSTSTIRYTSEYGTENDDFSTTIAEGAWYNLVTVQAGTNLTVYLNGSSIGTATVLAVGTWGTGLTIGKWAAGNYNYLDGFIDEVALFTSALSSSDATAIYNSGTPADLTSLSPIGWWRMGDGTEDGSGTTVYDMRPSGTPNNATLTNGPTFSTDVPSA